MFLSITRESVLLWIFRWNAGRELRANWFLQDKRIATMTGEENWSIFEPSWGAKGGPDIKAKSRTDAMCAEVSSKASIVPQTSSLKVCMHIPSYNILSTYNYALSDRSSDPIAALTLPDINTMINTNVTGLINLT